MLFLPTALLNGVDLRRKSVRIARIITDILLVSQGGLAGDGKTPCDTRTEAQKSALKRLLGELHKRYPKALIVGHCDLDPQKPYCPGFKNFEF